MKTRLSIAAGLTVGVALAAAVLMAQPAQNPESFPCAAEATYLVEVSAAVRILEQSKEAARDAEIALAEQSERLEVLRRQFTDMVEDPERKPANSLRAAALGRMADCIVSSFP